MHGDLALISERCQQLSLWSLQRHEYAVSVVRMVKRLLHCDARTLGDKAETSGCAAALLPKRGCRRRILTHFQSSGCGFVS